MYNTDMSKPIRVIYANKTQDAKPRKYSLTVNENGVYRCGYVKFYNLKEAATYFSKQVARLVNLNYKIHGTRKAALAYAK